MSYLSLPNWVTKMVDAGESKIPAWPRASVLIRAFMAGAIPAIAAVFAV